MTICVGYHAKDKRTWVIRDDLVYQLMSTDHTNLVRNSKRDKHNSSSISLHDWCEHNAKLN